MFLSVVIPVFNAAPFLRECLDSLRAQTFADWEALCVDDGSTDDSAAILREYAERDPRFVVISKANSGYGATVNLGLARARGDYVAILEPDDALASPDAYARLAELVARFPGIDVVKGDYNFYRGKSGRRERAFALRACPKGVPVNARGCGELFALPLSVWSAFYRADFLRAAAIRFNETPGASYQDNAFSFKVFAAAERVVLADFPVVDYRQDNAASSMKSREKVFCVADEMHELDRWFAERPALRERFAYDFWLFRYKAYFANLLRAPRERRGEFFALFRREFVEARERGGLPEALFPRLGKRLPLLLDAPEKFLRYATWRARFDAFRRAKKNTLSVRRSRDGWRVVLCGLSFVFPKGDRR